MLTRGYQRPLARINRPLVRRSGILEPASWDDALTLVARRFEEIRAAHGADAFCCFSCSKATNEVNFWAQKLARAAVGSNNIDSCNRT